MSIALAIILFCFCYGLIKTNTLSSELKKQLDLNSVRMIYYPLVFTLFAVPSAFDDLAVYYYGKDSEILSFFHLLISHAMGFANALVYRFISQN